jgi:gas vesicle protein
MANNGEKFLYFLIGGFVGASVALLFAPKSGEETRHLLSSKYRQGSDEVTRRIREGKDYLSETKSDLSEKLSHTIEKGRDTVNRQKDQIATAIEAGKKAYQEEKEKLSESPESEESGA